MQNIDLTNFKAVVEPQFVELIKNSFTPEITLSIARGMGYTEKIKETVERVEKQNRTFLNENNEEVTQEVDVVIFEEIEIDNPKTAYCYVANKFIDILFNESIRAIETHYRRDIIPETINTLLKPFDELLNNR